MSEFKKILSSDKPRERLINYGAENLSNEELLAILLKTGSKNYNVKEVAIKILECVSTIDKLSEIGLSTLMKIDGVGMVKAVSIKAALELGKRVYTCNGNTCNIKFNNSNTIYNYFKDIIGYKKQEYFYTIYLDTKGKYLDKKCLFIGTINNSVIHPREIFKEAYLLSASTIVCLHNHPSNDTTPSQADIKFTNES